MAHIPEFYAHRDHDDVGIYALSKFDLEKRVPMELELGFDSCVSNSLYQSSTQRKSEFDRNLVSVNDANSDTNSQSYDQLICIIIMDGAN